MYCNPNCTVVGFTVTKGKVRFHGSNVGVNQYRKILEKEGRDNIVLVKVDDLPRERNAEFLLESKAYLAIKDKGLRVKIRKELARVIERQGAIRRLHGYSLLPSNKSFMPAREAA